MSPTRHALRAELTRLAQQPVAGPSVAFQARLERQLIGTVDARPDATLRALPRRRRRLVSVVSVAAATVATVVLVALLGAFGHGGRGSLQLGTARDTTVVLPGGHTVTGRTGLGLPDGAVVRTGPNGHAAAGPVELGPGLQGTVDAGRIQLQPLPVVPPNLSPVTPPPALNVPTITLPAIPSIPSIPSPTLPGALGLGH